MLKRVSAQRLSHKKDIVCPETGVAGKEDREGEGRVEARTHTHTPHAESKRRPRGNSCGLFDTECAEKHTD